MYRAIYLLTIAVVFLRDYLSDSPNIESFLFTLIIVEGCSELLTRAVRLRLSNNSPGFAYYYAKGVTVTIAVVLFILASVITILVIGFQDAELIREDFLWVTPIACIYRYYSHMLMISREFINFYGLEFLKGVGVLGGLLLASDSLILGAYILVAGVSVANGFKYKSTLKLRGQFAVKKGRVLIRRMLYLIPAQLQFAIALLVFIFDKYYFDSKGEDILLFLLASKFCVSVVGMFNSLTLQVWQVENKSHRLSISIITMIRTFTFHIVFVVTFYLIFFFIIFPFLPISEQVAFNVWLLLGGAAMLTANMVRDVIVRWHYMRNQHSSVGIVVSLGFITYLLFILYFDAASVVNAMFFLAIMYFLTSVWLLFRSKNAPAN